MDYWMPILDGLSATAQLRADPELSSVQVLAVSAAVSHSGNEAARDAGCDAFVNKPVMPEQLIDHLRLLLRQRRAE
jgi:CheY-like chemotaxis protein